jgi:hypothetical protein
VFSVTDRRMRDMAGMSARVARRNTQCAVI